ncbi:Aste57867_16615 [Aphanomyces stellatus]|uniref:Aste57867_16615 protein n=1 Tax=Aphanomyces stellatus TaxID=120398 RepID=A0A485L627_9STRA|nr:hypothetical protein As57867_016558 [Aphanomyces stellatus]VFT93386.1 Aste57867_16615 [Aphanomyces stellatus]
MQEIPNVSMASWLVTTASLQTGGLGVLQVELNTISASFAFMSSIVANLHDSSLNATKMRFYRRITGPSGTPRGIAGKPRAPGAAVGPHEGACTIWQATPNETNSVDQRWLEYTLWETHRVKVLCWSLHERAMAELHGIQRELWIDGAEVAVAYFRSAYTPTDYPSEFEWTGHKTVERWDKKGAASAAQLRRFMTEAESVVLEKSFTGLYGLEQTSPDLPRIKVLVETNPEGFVLKPQREGGGNNLDEVADAIKTWTPAELQAYILMDRIWPQEQPATNSELGVFGVALFDHGKAVFNEHAGHFLRTKLSSTNEGGVAAGFAVLSSPFLV